jgi:RimJ/RimL family protein N-acetyltransferase
MSSPTDVTGPAAMSALDSYTGELVRLRAFEADDEDRLYEFFNDRDVMENMGGRFPESRKKIRERLERWAQPAYDLAAFAVTDLAERRLIGAVALRGASPEVRDAEVDLLLGDKSFWGRGYGTDTMRTLLRVGFEQMNLHRIHLWAYTRNVPAVRVYEKVGFVHEVLARESWYKDGVYLDAHLMSVLRHEWEAAR